MRVACVFALLIATSTSRASGPGAPPTESQVEVYWSRLLVPDAIATSLLVVGFAALSGEEPAPGGAVLALAGAVTYALGAPLVHGARNNNGPAFASLGLRVALPAASAWLAGRTGDDDDETNRRIRLGLFAGMLTAVVIDHALLARQTVEVAPRRWSPTAVPSQDGVSLGIAGTF